MADKKDLLKKGLTSNRRSLKKSAPNLKESEKIVEAVHEKKEELEENKNEIQSESPQKKHKEPVQRVTIDFPASVYVALKHRTFDRRITIKKYMVELAKKDLGL